MIYDLRVRLTAGGAPLELSDEPVFYGGYISIDYTQSGRVTLLDPKGSLRLLLQSLGDLLGIRVEILVMIDYDWYRLATAVINNRENTYGIDGHFINLNLADPSTYFSANDRAVKYIVPADVAIPEAFTNYIHSIDPSIEVAASAFGTDTVEYSVTYDLESDPWADAQDFAKSVGGIAYFDNYGVCNLVEKRNDIETRGIDFTYADAGDSGLPIVEATISDTINPTQIVNGVIVRGEASWLRFPVSGEAWVTDPSKEIYYDPANPTESRVGPHPVIEGSSIAGSDAYATSQAEKLLEEQYGIHREVNLTVPINPLLSKNSLVFLALREANFSQRVSVEYIRHDLSKATSNIVGRVIA